MYAISLLWFYGLKAMMTDCLSVDLGSIPNRIVIIILPYSSVGSSNRLLSGGSQVQTLLGQFWIELYKCLNPLFCMGEYANWLKQAVCKIVT